MVDFKRADQRIPDHGQLPPPCTWDKAPSYEEELARTGDAMWARIAAGDLVFATCPKLHTCRIVKSIHSVRPDGALSPSYVCPVAGCGFHAFVRLVGWPGG